MIYADVFIDMGAGTADGTTPTAINMAANTHGSYNTYTINGAAAGMTIESPTGLRRYDSVQIPGYAFGPNYSSKALKYLHTTAFQTSVEVDFNYAAVGKATCFGLITFGPANVGASGNIFDLIRFDSAYQGKFAVMQLDNGGGVTPGDYRVSLETSPGGVTTKTGKIRVTPGGTYWFNLRVDYDWRPGRTPNVTDAVASRAELAFFHPYTGQMLGYIVAPVLKILTTADKCDVVNGCKIGNQELKTDPGTSSYFKHIGFDLRYARFPILPRQVMPMSALMPQLMATVAGAAGGSRANFMMLGIG